MEDLFIELMEYNNSEYFLTNDNADIQIGNGASIALPVIVTERLRRHHD